MTVKKKKKLTRNRVKKIFKILGLILSVFLLVILVVSATPPLRVYASGWVEEVTNITAEYTKYPISHYSLDFFVDTSWDWLPWNWGEGIGNTAYYAVYLLTNVFWILNAYLSYLMGYIVEQAYNLDFISDTISHIAKNIQTIAGVDSSGFKDHGLLPSFAPIMIVIIGAYFAYVGLFKRQLTKAMSSLVTFIVVFVFGMGFISYSSDYLTKINNFQKEFNQEVLTIGSKLTMSNSTIDSEDSVTSIRDSLFEIQVKKPYLLLQFGDSDETVIGEDRVVKLLESDPNANDKTRAEVVKEEVSDKSNSNMSIQMVPMRLGMVLVIFIVNLVIDFCVSVFSGLMIFSQVLFVLYMCFLPVAIVFALVPGGSRVLTKAISKSFNAMMTKGGITLLMTVVFSISSMCYALSATSNFFWMMFLQVVVFVGSLLQANELLGFMHLNNHDSEQMNRKANTLSLIGQQAMNLSMYKGLKNKIAPTSGAVPTSSGGEGNGNSGSSGKSTSRNGRKNQRKDRSNENPYAPKNRMEQVGAKASNVADVPNKVKNKVNQVKQGVKDAPTNARYAVKKAKDDVLYGAVKKESENNAQRHEGRNRRDHTQQRRQEVLNRGNNIQQRLAGEKKQPLVTKQETVSARRISEAKSKANNPLTTTPVRKTESTTKGTVRLNEAKIRKVVDQSIKNRDSEKKSSRTVKK